MAGRRILFVAASPTYGGGERYVCELARALRLGGDRVWIAAPRRSDPILRRALEEAAGAQSVCYLPLRSMTDVASAMALRRLVQREGITIIHCNRFGDAFLAVAALPRVKVLLTRHLVRPGKRNPLYRWLYRRLHRLIFVSQLARDAFMETAPTLPPGKVVVVYNGVPDFDPTGALLDARALCGVVDGEPVVAFIGRVVPEKGVDVLYAAAGRLAACGVPFRLLVVGQADRAYEAFLEERAAAEGIADRTFRIPFCDRVGALLRGGIDLVVSPTVGREAFGLVVAECMQAGVALIATDNGAPREFLLPGVDAVLVPPGNVGALAQAMKLLLKDESARRRIAAAARRTFTRCFGYDRFLERITALYDAPK